MKKSFVPPSVLRQKASQLQKEKPLSWHPALDEAAVFYGFTNYKNFQNMSEANRKEREISKNIFLETLSQQKSDEISKKLGLINSQILHFKMPFQDLLDSFKQSRHSDVQSICEKKSDLKEYIELHFLRDFLEDEGGEIADFAPYHLAKEVFLKNLNYAVDEDMLRVEGDFSLKLEFGFEYDPATKDDFFAEREMFGSFELTIDRDKKVIFENQDLGHYW